MSSQGFSFPPPPPPPPRQQQQQPQQQQYNHATYPPSYGQSYNGQRGGRGGGRGRGRGYGNRGSGRGGHFATSSQAYTSNTAPSVGYTPVNYGFAAQPYPTPTPGIPAPQYTAASPQPSSFQHTTFPSPQPFSQPTSYNGIYNPSTAPTTPAYPSTMPPYQHASPSTQPSMMGPPMHWGFEQPGPTGAFPPAQHGNNWAPRPFNHHAYGNNSPMGDKPMKHSNKRDHTSAFSKPRVPAPPAVPSFGNPLPTKPPPPSDASRKPKKKRKHNQLGLTPKTEEHESSEEDDDLDEESKLTSGGTGAATAALRFTYKGRTATLQTPEEIAAWIEERKKRFPTRAKAEEKKKAMEEAKKAREEALKQKRESRNQDTKRPQKGGRGQEQQQRDASGNPVDAAAKATQKADKLRRKLLREQKRVAKAEADAEQARLKVEELQKESTVLSTGPGEDRATKEPQETAQSPATAGEPVSGEGHEPLKPGTASLTETQLDKAEISSSLDTSDGSDWTSSSGSEDSSSESEESDDDDNDDDDNDSDSAPEEMTSRREGPERVPPPPRDNIKKRVCRHFARNGRCLRGDKCNFLHETPERKAKAKAVPQKGRKGLLHMLLNRQEEDDNHRVMDAIMWLGENGVLDEPTARESDDHHQSFAMHIDASAADA